MKPLTLLSLLSLICILTTGCATKGSRKIYALPHEVPTITSPKQELLAPNRVKPGEIMDPNVLTFAQIPSRIIYLPGGQTIFSRKSATQDISYMLQPIGTLTAPQANAAPPPSKQNQPKTPEIREIFQTAFTEEDGTQTEGTARRLGIFGKSGVEQERAELLLKEKEILKWSADAGWVAFTPQNKTMPVASKQPALEIKEEIEAKPIEPPTILTPTADPTPTPAPQLESSTPPTVKPQTTIENENAPKPQPQTPEPPAEKPNETKQGTGLEIEF